MEVLKWIGQGFAIVVAAVFCLFVYVFIRMAFVAQFTELGLLRDRVLRVLLPGVEIKEVSHQLSPLEWEHESGPGAVPKATSLLLTPDGQLQSEETRFDGDPRRYVDELSGADSLAPWILFESRIYQRNGDTLGQEIADLSEAPFTGFGYVAGLNDEWFLVAGDVRGDKNRNSRLWQVSKKNFDVVLLEKNPYFTFSRPPKTFTPEGFDGVLVAVYRGVVSYGFGGDCSRPRYSILRAYTSTYPLGIDLARFSFRAGTIVDVAWQDGALVVTGDPSRPAAAGRDRIPPRVWRVGLPDGVVGMPQRSGATEPEEVSESLAG
ncbi:hypothetical protein [Microbulbifer mangrovi]|uniref:hypothetical protein n=1 Tax=Microbulbifer mangrovi TaxID=927787 RepID=UPI0009905E6F|nr:hypothetical protein [Microbulbifer mangrovi]